MVSRASSLKELDKQVRDAGLPAFPAATLRGIIASKVKDDFLGGLVDVLSQKDPSGEQMDMLTAVCSACSEETLRDLEMLGFNIKQEDLALIGAESGKTFAVSVRDAASGSNTSAQSLNYLKVLLSAHTSAPEFQHIAPMVALVPEEQNTGTRNTGPHKECTPIPPENAPAHKSPTREGEGRGGLPRSYRVYGSRCAICWNESTTKGGEPTVSIDAAEVVITANGKTNDWTNKISLQLTLPELPMLLAVMKAKTPKFEVFGHGEKHDKGLTVEYQSGKWFVSVKHGKNNRSVPIFPGDAFWVTAMLQKQLMANSAGTDMATLNDLIEVTARAMNDANSTQ